MCVWLHVSDIESIMKLIIIMSWICFPAELSQAVVDAGAVPLLVLCIQEPELSLKRIASSALSDICKHSPEVILPEQHNLL